MLTKAQEKGPSFPDLGVGESGSLRFLDEARKLRLPAETEVVWGPIQGKRCHLAGLVLLVLGEHSIQAVCRENLFLEVKQCTGQANVVGLTEVLLAGISW